MGLEDNSRFRAYSDEPGTSNPEAQRRSDLSDIKTFRTVKTYPVLGYIFLAASVCLLLLPLAPYEALKYIFAALLGVPGIYLLLAYYVSGVSLYPEKIVHYSFSGRKRVFLWSDITSALIHYTYGKSYVHEDIYLYSGSKKIALDKRFKNYELIKAIIKERCRAAFLMEKIGNGGTEALRIDNGIYMIVFCFIPFGIILAFLCITFYSKLSSDDLAFCLVGSVAFTFIGFVQLLLWLFSRVYINAESITHINLFGVKTRLMWSEIESVTFSRPDARLSGIKLSGGGKTIILNSNYMGFEGVKEIISKYHWKYNR